MAFYNQTLSFGFLRKGRGWGIDRALYMPGLNLGYHKYIKPAQPGSRAIYKVRFEERETDFIGWQRALLI